MIGISRLYCQSPETSDQLRYERPTGQPSRPVVVFNCTRRCNLRCVHCYSASTDADPAGQLSTDQARDMIDDLAGFGVPVLLLSGGEPLLRQDIFELIGHARQAGIRTAISTNGTLITPQVAGRLAEADLNYAGISLDGVGPANDRFRGSQGAFELALAGIRNCQAAGIKVGLRMTLTTSNVDQVPAVFDLVEAEGIGRVCFYHLVATGRGECLQTTLTDHRTRQVLDLIIDRTAAAHAAGRGLQVLTVDNHADGPYLYLRLLRQDADRASTCLQLLSANAGNASGERIGCVRWNGDVLPDQFWPDQVLSNIRHRPFSEIWSDPTQPLLAKLRNRKQHLTGRCTRCRWLDVCNGNLRARAGAAGDIWGDDPACYLSDEEIRP